MGVILTPMTLLKARMGELSVGLLFSVFSHAPTPKTQKYVCLHIYYYFCLSIVYSRAKVNYVIFDLVIPTQKNKDLFLKCI